MEELPLLMKTAKAYSNLCSIALLFLAAACGGEKGLVITASPAKGLALKVEFPSVATTVGQPLASVKPVVAAGGAGNYSFTMSKLPEGLTFDVTTGAVSGMATAAQAATPVTVSVTDQFTTAKATETFSLTVNARPTLVVDSLTVSRQLTQNTLVPAFSPATGLNGTPTLTYAVSPLLPAGLSVTAATGAISGTPTGVLPTPTTFSLTVTDATGATAAAPFTLVINPALTLAVSSATVDGTVGVAISTVTTLITGGTPPVSTEVTGLPSGVGLSSDATGRVFGTPTGAITATVTVAASDGAGAKKTAQFTLTVKAAPTATSAITAKTCTQQSVCAFIPVTGAGGNGNLVYSVLPTTLPAGLTFSPGTGGISGTPTATAAASTYTVTVRDANGAQASSNFTLAVNAPIVATSNATAKVCTQGGPCDVTPISVTGGTLPIAYSITPALPAGISLANVTGQITGPGTSTLAATAFTITATDANNATSSKQFTLTVNPPIVTTLGAATYSCTANAACAFTALTATGGTAPVSFELSGGTLPEGLKFNPEMGAISGTATESLAATTFRITATDAAQAKSFKEFSFGVSGPLSTTLLMPVVETTINVLLASAFPAGVRPVSGSGGTGALLYTITPALPGGLSWIPATGSITGTPLVSDSRKYRVTVSDQAAASSFKDFTLTVNAVPMLVGSNVQCVPLVACSVSPLLVSAGTAPYKFAVTTALPAGLSMIQANGAIVGTASANFAPATYTGTVVDAVGATASTTFTLSANLTVNTVLKTASVANTIGVPFPPGVIPVSGSGGAGALRYTISPDLPTGLSLDPTTGAIGGTPQTAGSLQRRVTVTDALGATSFKDFTLTINQALVWVTPPNPGSTVFCAQNVTCAGWVAPTQGGTTPLTASVTPALPPGLSIAITGGSSVVISGVATQLSPNALYTVTVRDVVGATATNTLNLSVVPALTTVVAIQEIGCGEVNQCTAGVSFTPVTASGGSGTLSFSILPSLPVGLTLDAINGNIIVGQAGVAGIQSTQFTVTARDQIGQLSSKSFKLSSLRSTSLISTQTCTILVSCTFSPIGAIGGTAPLAWQITGLSTGLVINPSTGVISGIPTQYVDPYYPSVVITDALGRKAVSLFTLRVLYPPIVATQAIAEVGCGEDNGCTSVLPFTPVVGSGGQPPLYFAITPQLPTGMSIDHQTGAISGLPTGALVSTAMTVTVSPEPGFAGASKSFLLSVLRSTSNVTAKSCVVGTSCAMTPVTATGGKGTVTYALSGGFMPAWIVFSPSTGAFSGTPNGTFAARTFTVTATDALGRITSKSFTLSVQ